MLFPPAMEQLAGESDWQALISFILTDADIAWYYFCCVGGQRNYGFREFDK